MSGGQKQLPCSKWCRSICQCKPKRDRQRKQIETEELIRKRIRQRKEGDSRGCLKGCQFR